MALDNLISKMTDPYDRQARLYPALLTLFPLLTMTTLIYAAQVSVLTGVVSLAVSCGGLYLLTNLCRQSGKRVEEKLFEKWGGKPTTQLLRHRDQTIEAVTKRRYHSFLASKINEPFPDANQEEKYPQAADETYQSGVRWLLNHTRPEDGKKFELLFKENITYGFRRNALGMKPLGLIVSFGTAAWILKREGVFVFSSGQKFIVVDAFGKMPEAAIVSLAVSMISVVVWFVFFTEASLRTAAFTYAEMLLRACDTL